MTLARRFARKFSERNNAVYRDILYQLDKEAHRQVKPRINAACVWIDETNCASTDLFGPEIVADFKTMLAERRIGLFGLFEDRPIAYCWAIVGQTASPWAVNNLVSLKCGQAYILFCQTHDEYRGKGIYPWLLSVLTEHLFEDRHIDVVFINTDVRNVSSQKGIIKVGFRPIREVSRMVFLGWQLALTSRAI